MIIVYGTLCLDRIRRIPRLPDKGASVEIVEEHELLGGEAANTANALNRWGQDVVLASNAIGTGPAAARLSELVDESGLDRSFIPIGNVPTPYCDIYITPDGERTLFARGFSMMDKESSIAHVPFQRNGWFTADPNHGAPAREVVKKAHKAGMRIYLLDFMKDDDPIFPGSFWQGSTDWIGFKRDKKMNMAWASDWSSRYGCFTILTDGRHGFVLGIPGADAVHYEAFSCTEVLDSTGAGDIFRAGMLYGLDHDWPVENCLRFASAAGCLSCAGFGATGFVPSLDEVLTRAGLI